jgi:hypothetical protein
MTDDVQPLSPGDIRGLLAASLATVEARVWTQMGNAQRFAALDG